MGTLFYDGGSGDRSRLNGSLSQSLRPPYRTRAPPRSVLIYLRLRYGIPFAFGVPSDFNPWGAAFRSLLNA